MIGLVVLTLATPLGMVAKGTAWGEWGAEELKKLLGFAPEELQRLGTMWNAKMPDYSVPVTSSAGHPMLGYLLSALAGVGIILLFTWLLGQWLTKGKRDAS